MEAVAAGGGQRQRSHFKQSHRRGLRSNSEQEFRNGSDTPRRRVLTLKGWVSKGGGGVHRGW
jgi:hypothetical protein